MHDVLYPLLYPADLAFFTFFFHPEKTNQPATKDDQSRGDWNRCLSRSEKKMADYEIVLPNPDDLGIEMSKEIEKQLGK